MRPCPSFFARIHGGENGYHFRRAVGVYPRAGCVRRPSDIASAYGRHTRRRMARRPIRGSSRMNITQLRAFVTVVEAGSFSEAARQMGLSQPAVTMQIQGLETDLGVTLMERRYRKVDLTEAGRSLLPYARRVLAELDSAREEIDRLSDTVGGHLELAVST